MLFSQQEPHYFDGRLYIYYGAADKRIAAASVDLEELISEIIAIKKASTTINEILMVTLSSPKCGIATYSQDLIKSIEDKYCDSFTIKVCVFYKKQMLSYIILVKSLIFLKNNRKKKIIKDHGQ
jgi:hypothetical protein